MIIIKTLKISAILLQLIFKYLEILIRMFRIRDTESTIEFVLINFFYIFFDLKIYILIISS